VLHLAWVLACWFFSHASVRGQTIDDPILRAIDLEAQRHAMGYDWLRWSTDHIGHRLTGSTNGAMAEASADSLFYAGGAERVSFFPFSARAWTRGRVRTTVIGASGEEVLLTSVALALTPDSIHVTTPLIDAGNGLSVDIARLGDTLRGKIALVNLQLVNAPFGSSNLHRSEKTALALAAGAAGVVFVNHVEGHVLLTGTASADGDVLKAPVVCVGKEEGSTLRERLASEELTVTISMTNRNALVTARNVICELPGTDPSAGVIVVGGHLDSWDLATGATDNGLGSYSILDLARCFHALNLRPKRTIRFILFMGEEEGLLGSTALVKAWKEQGELADVRCMINMDMSGHPKGFNVCGPEGWTPLVQGMQARMVASDTTFRAQFNNEPGLHSDHQPFMLAGVPTLAPICDLGGHVYGCYHSSCDDIHLVDPQAMVNNVRRVGQLLWQLANAPELPGHFTEKELRARLVAAGLEEKLRIQKSWPW
jgi:carboxypeptidase Q